MDLLVASQSTTRSSISKDTTKDYGGLTLTSRMRPQKVHRISNSIRTSKCNARPTSKTLQAKALVWGGGINAGNPIGRSELYHLDKTASTCDLITPHDDRSASWLSTGHVLVAAAWLALDSTT